MPEPGRALAGVRVLDLADAYGAYASRLLSDLGAEVLRIEGLGAPDPIWPAPTRGHVDLGALFVNAGKAVLHADSVTEADLEALVGASDVVIEAAGRLDGVGFDRERVAVLNPDLVRVTVSPFGGSEPEDGPVDDLLVLAAGGLMHLGGYRDLGPMGAWGGQSAMAASIFGAVAALIGLISGRSTFDVSAQESVAQALEDSVAEFALVGIVRDRRGESPREAGTGTFHCSDGYVSMVAGRLGTARAWSGLVAWLTEEGAPGAEVLSDEQWSDFHHRRTPAAIDMFTGIFEAFAESRSKESLYRDAQERGIALSPVNDMASVLADRQLAERGFFVEVEDEELGPVVYPGPPYRLSASPVLSPLPMRAADRDAVAAFIRAERGDG
jgi:benzylsuccinate CoA-transferase BbsE subunit